MDVRVADNEFAPSDTQLARGATLRFAVDEDAANPHKVTIHKAGDDLGEMQLNESVWAGDAVDFKFVDGGTYHVWCPYHGNMTDGMHMSVKVD